MLCTKLNYIKVGFSDWKYLTELTTDNGTYNWVTKVAATGDFYCPPSLNQTISDAHHIPAGWNIHPSSGQMLTFEANGGEWVDGTNESITIAQSAIEDIPHAVKNGCMFTRWNTKADGTGKDINLGNLPDEDVTYYAQYDSIGVQLQKWQANAVFLSIIGLPDDVENAILQVVGGGSAKESTLGLSKIDVDVYQLGFNKNDVKLHQGGILDVILTDEDGTQIGVVSLQIPFIISGDVNSSTLDDTEHSDIWILNGATLTFDDDRACQTLCVSAGGKVVVPDGRTLTTEDIVLRGCELRDGSYLFDYPQMVVNGSIRNASGKVNYQYMCGLQQQYALSLPVTVNVADITYLDGQSATMGVYRYSGEMRAQKKSGWEEIWDPTRDDMTPPDLKAGQGYTIYGVPMEVKNGQRRNYCYLNFPMTMDLTQGEYSGDSKMVSVTHPGMTEGQLDNGVRPNDAGWNLIGNPYLANFTGTTGDGFENGVIGELKKGESGYDWVGSARYVVIPSDNGQNYTAEMVKEATLPAFKNFFVQVGQGDELSFAKEARAQNAPRHLMQTTKEVMLGVRLTGCKMDDRMGLLLDDTFTEEYELNADLDKWPNSGLNVSAVVGAYSLAIAAVNHERAMQPIALMVKTNKPGTYTFRLADEWTKNYSDVEHLYLYDSETQTYTDLLNFTYDVDLLAKTYQNRFYLSAEGKFLPTGMDIINEEGISVISGNGRIYIYGLRPDAHVRVFTMMGTCVYNEDVDSTATLPLETGVYILCIEMGDKTYTWKVEN